MFNVDIPSLSFPQHASLPSYTDMIISTHAKPEPGACASLRKSKPTLPRLPLPSFPFPSFPTFYNMSDSTH
jgi:hypothetical protein